MKKINQQVQYYEHNGFIIIIESESDGFRNVYLRKNGYGFTLYLYGVYGVLPELKRIIENNFYKYANDYYNTISKLKR